MELGAVLAVLRETPHSFECDLMDRAGAGSAQDGPVLGHHPKVDHHPRPDLMNSDFPTAGGNEIPAVGGHWPGAGPALLRNFRFMPSIELRARAVVPSPTKLS